MSYKIAIIIPIINEAEAIADVIESLMRHSAAENVSEIIIVDGGSTDGSREIVYGLTENAKHCNVISDASPTLCETSEISIRLITSEKGRAKQMNAGAKVASASILYFLHADSEPPKHFDQYIIDEVRKGNNAGCFRMEFDSTHWWLRLASWLTQFSWRACRGGDQSQFITRQLFDDIGGYNESYIIYEDNILINELFARDQFVVINKKLKTSARRYRKYGIWKLQFHFWIIYVKKWFGADANQLLAYYKKHIS